MEKLTRGVLKMSNQTISENLHSATSSPESAYGHTPCAKQGGQTTNLCGQGPRLVSRSARQARELGLLTSGTSGRTSSRSSSSADLQSSSESRLMQRLRAGGGI